MPPYTGPRFRSLTTGIQLDTIPPCAEKTESWTKVLTWDGNHLVWRDSDGHHRSEASPSAQMLAEELAQQIRDNVPGLAKVSVNSNATITILPADSTDLTMQCSEDRHQSAEVKIDIVEKVRRLLGETWGDYAQRTGQGPPGNDRQQWLQQLKTKAGER